MVGWSYFAVGFSRGSGSSGGWSSGSDFVLICSRPICFRDLTVLVAIRGEADTAEYERKERERWKPDSTGMTLG